MIALKLKRRPPLTTFATLLIWTTRSSSVSLLGSILANYQLLASELKAGFAGGVGERLDPPVIPEPGSIEDDRIDPRAPGALGQEATDDLGLIDLLLAWGPEFLFEARGGGQRVTGGVVDYLGRDVFVSAEYDQARALGRAREAKPDPLVPLLARGPAAGDLRHRAGPFVILGRLTSCRRSCRPCRPYGGSSRLGSERPCPCTVRACD